VVRTKILLVAESSPRAANIRVLLQEHGHDIFHAASPTEATEALEIQRFDLLLWDGNPGAALSILLDPAQSRHNLRLVVIRSDAAEGPLRLARGEPPVDALIEGRFSYSRLAEIVDELVRNFASPSGQAGPFPAEATLCVFEREQFERQMNYDRRLMSEIIELFVTETSHQIFALQNALDAGLNSQVKRLAHSLKGSFGAAYAHKAGALAREMEAAATGDLSYARKIMPRLQSATTEIQSKLEQILAE
jgi:HPt (histidine-containing phosphotransfer) domain-containing protein